MKIINIYKSLSLDFLPFWNEEIGHKAHIIINPINNENTIDEKICIPNANLIKRKAAIITITYIMKTSSGSIFKDLF